MGKKIKLKKRDIISLGKYRGEPILWRVLDVTDDKALILTDKIIEYFDDCSKNYEYYDGQKFSDLECFKEHPDYSKSEIRKWLNKEFYKSFSPKEKKIILKTEVDNGWDSLGGLPSPFTCKNTDDYVFLLSVKEVKEYLPQSERSPVNTDYEMWHRCQSNLEISWLLRTPDAFQGFLTADALGQFYSCREFAIRPAMYISINTDDMPFTLMKPCEAKQDKSPFLDAKKRSKISFGTYASEKIRWLVLDVKDNKALLLSSKIIEERAYDSKGRCYAESDIRSWLNNEFYNGFTPEEKSRILRTNVDNSAYTCFTHNEQLRREYMNTMFDYDSYMAEEYNNCKPCENTEDYFFLLSREEKARLLSQSESACAMASYLPKQWASAYWGLRSWGNVVYKAAGYTTSCNPASEMGIRPAVWIDISDNPQPQTGSISTFSLIKKRDETYDRENRFISFGSYYGEKIKWRVLRRNGNKALIVTNNIMDLVVVDEKEHLDYPETSLRKWLNNEFIKEFTEEEKEKIIPVRKEDFHDGDLMEKCTGDLAFVLSSWEKRAYFDGEFFEGCAGTKHANEIYAKEKARGAIWDCNKTGSYVVTSFGYTRCRYSYGPDYLAGSKHPVRPAMWIDISDNPKITDENGNAVRGDWNVKLKVKDSGYGFGTYDGESMKWRVLEIRDGRALILCNRIIDTFPQDRIWDKQCNNYAASPIRAWLNNEFLSSFTEKERKKLCMTVVDNGLKSTLDEKNGNICENTEDYFFLLSKEEVRRYFKTPAERICSMTVTAIEHGFCIEDYDGAGASGRPNWLLRSPTCWKEMSMIDYQGLPDTTRPRWWYGIRPACWITIDEQDDFNKFIK